MFFNSNLFLIEQYNIINIVLDSIIIFLIILLFEIYEYSYYRINKTKDIAIPAILSLAFQSPYMFALPILQGFIFAIFDLPIQIYGPLASFVYLLNYFILIYIFKINYTFIFIFINIFLFLVAYFVFSKRIAYRSLSPPVGWLNSWLGGKYYVEDVVGVGGFSYVLKVSAGRQKFAAKVLRYVDDRGAPLASSWDVIKIFGQEMNKYLEVLSDYVVKAYEVSIPSTEYRSLSDYMRNPPYMILEYMEGGSLREYLIEKRTLSLDEFFRIFIQILKGLNDIHKNNLGHLDIKPENIMFKDREKAVVKIGDLGIAKLAVGKAVAASYLSPAYAAPETLYSQTASKASDIYSLGCVMYESLTGINPQSFVINGYEIPPPDRYRPEIPSWLSGLIMSMLSPRPEARPTAEQILGIFENYISGAGVPQ
jgi:serine/threonine-protein kinase